MSQKESSQHQNVRRVAIELLSRREHSSFELKRKLVSRSFDLLEIKEVLAELRDEGLQSDVRFSEAYVYSRAQKGYGPLRIQADLKQRGIDDLLLKEFLDFQSSEWNKRAIDAQKKRFGSIPPENYKDYAKQVRFLQYRGFTADQIKIALGEINL